MISDIKDYCPSEVSFALSDSAKGTFPGTIFDGATDVSEVMRLVHDKFQAVYPDGELADRRLDDFEIRSIREEYCLLQENEIPKRMAELAEAMEEAKRIKREAEERLQSVAQTIRELAARVKAGTQEFALESGTTFRIALCGQYAYYSWVDGRMQLVKTEAIPEWDRQTLWSQTEANRQAMHDLFGYTLPEEERVASSGGDEGEDF